MRRWVDRLDAAAEVLRALARPECKPLKVSKVHGDLDVTIRPHRSITISGPNGPTANDFRATFEVGTQAEYDAYNLHYFGTIIGISPKTVTIREDDESPRSKKRRLRIADFVRRNCRPADRTRQRNAEWRD